jgi:hypothetical protein
MPSGVATQSTTSFGIDRLPPDSLQRNRRSSHSDFAAAIIRFARTASDARRDRSFVNDPDPDAWPKLIDKLLAQPQYGERWARRWMDVSRFAESHGYEQDYDRPHAYHYRDFLIRAFDQDMPWTQLVQWQLAGDRTRPRKSSGNDGHRFSRSGCLPNATDRS